MPKETASETSLRRLGEILVGDNVVTPRDIDQAVRMQAEVGGLIGQALLRLGALTEERLLEYLSAQLSLEVVDTAGPRPDEGSLKYALERLDVKPDWLAEKACVVWYAPSADPDYPPILFALAHNPLDPDLREGLDQALTAWPASETRPQYEFLLTDAATLEVQLDALREAAGLVDRSDDDEDDFTDDASRLRELAEEAPVIEFVNTVMANALKERASDIHIEPFEHVFQVRLRVDGVLQLRMTQPRRRFDAIASRIKLMSGMDIGERRLPQDGRQSIRFAGRDIDLRVSALPGTWGESIVLRLLEKEAELPDLTGLGIDSRSRTVLEQLLGEPNGIILVTGPTGSGKSTTLYRSLELINDGHRKIITIEDPVEYDMAGVTQIQVRSDIGYTFARGLRSILRQDPDVILVGEIRDGETASIAAQAALTGHLVLSTLHTNSALAAVPRLTDLGLESFLIGAAVRGLAAQRLVRRVCSECSKPGDASEGEALIARAQRSGAGLGDSLSETANWRDAVGCDACGGTGYTGRIAIFEIVNIDQTLRDAILEDASETELIAAARTGGYLSLMEDGLMKARRGLTTVAEVLRVCGAHAEAAD